jgi:hypothetical protein
VFYIGHEKLHWMGLAEAVKLLPKSQVSVDLRTRFGLASGAVQDATDLVSQRHRWMINRSDFHGLLISQRPRLCRDPLDKVYSILTLAGWAIRREITPDYTSDFGWLYCHATRLDINSKRGSINILRESVAKSSASLLPSWCPDWSSARTWSRLHEKKSGRPREVRFSSDLRSLTVPYCTLLDIVKDNQAQGTDEEFE